MKSFDPECLKLAEYFLYDYPGHDPHLLAGYIQEAVEGYLSSLPAAAPELPTAPASGHYADYREHTEAEREAQGAEMDRLCESDS